MALKDINDAAGANEGDEWDFKVSDETSIAKRMLEKDATGQVFATMQYMTTVEDWVINRLGKQDSSVAEQVKIRLQRLDAVIVQYRSQIPPDNFSFLQVLSWLSMDQCMYTIEYLQANQPLFFRQLIEHCRASQHDEINAGFTYTRIMTLLKGRLLDRILGPDNTDFVNRILVESL